MKKCPKCEKMMPTRSNNCKCGYLLCCVAARVLHFSAFIDQSIDRGYILNPMQLGDPLLLLCSTVVYY